MSTVGMTSVFSYGPLNITVTAENDIRNRRVAGGVQRLNLERMHPVDRGCVLDMGPFTACRVSFSLILYPVISLGCPI